MTDWQVGDLAVCVDARQNPRWISPISLVEGAVYRVTEVETDADYHFLWEDDGGGLHLAEAAPRPNGYAARRFRKIRPDEQQPCEEEFVTLLKRSKRTVTASDWLLRAGPIAKQLNDEARKERQS